MSNFLPENYGQLDYISAMPVMPDYDSLPRLGRNSSVLRELLHADDWGSYGGDYSHEREIRDKAYALREQGFVMPGIGHGLESLVSPSGPRWHSTDSFINPEGKRLEVVIGQMGAMKHIVDPKTRAAVTPGFHELKEVTDDYAIFRLGRNYVMHGISVETEKELKAKAREVGGSELPLFLYAAAIRVAPSDTKIQEDTSAEAYGRAIFDRAFQQVTVFVGRNKKLLQALQNPGQTVVLPDVRAQEVVTRLEVSGTSDGKSILRLQSYNEGDSQIGQGVVLVQIPSGDVMLMTPDFGTVLSSDDEQYSANMQLANQYLDSYFKAARIQANGEIMANTSAHDMRRRLGGVSLDTAQQKIHKAAKTR